MIVVYPVNGKNERMGSLFKTAKHMLTLNGIEIIKQSIKVVSERFNNPQVIIATNDAYYEDLAKLFATNPRVKIEVVGKTNSQVETLKKITSTLQDSILFVDCDIVPMQITDFNAKYPTVFTFENKSKLLNYSNFKATKFKTVIDCNEKEKLYRNAGTGIYYFPSVEDFNKYSINCNSVSQCVKAMLEVGVKVKINTDSVVRRLGTLQDVYVDNFSFRQPKAKDLSTGFTDNKVHKVGRTVKKSGGTIDSEYVWYCHYTNKNQIPKIIDYNKQSLIMEFIKRDADVDLDIVLESIHKYKDYERLNDLPFQSYVDNIRKHLIGNGYITNGGILLRYLNELNIEPTFCHGDLSIMNIIPTKKGIKLIDPLYSSVKFGSYELDIAKLCFSFKFYKNDLASFEYIKSRVDIPNLDILIAAEAVRVSSYKREYSFVAENLIRELGV